jgi:hypothetical protein
MTLTSGFSRRVKDFPICRQTGIVGLLIYWGKPQIDRSRRAGVRPGFTMKRIFSASGRRTELCLVFLLRTHIDVGVGILKLGQYKLARLNVS